MISILRSRIRQIAWEENMVLFVTTWDKLHYDHRQEGRFVAWKITPKNNLVKENEKCKDCLDEICVN